MHYIELSISKELTFWPGKTMIGITSTKSENRSIFQVFVCQSVVPITPEIPLGQFPLVGKPPCTQTWLIPPVN